MALDKDIVGSIEFLEVVGLQGSTYLLKGQMMKVSNSISQKLLMKMILN